jgi:hypothetical protein
MRMSMQRIVKRSSRVSYGWGIIQVKVSFLDTLTMISLRIRQSKQALFQEVTVNSQCQNAAQMAYAETVTYSFSFQKANAMFSKPWVSETPAIPSSPHRYVLDRE